MTERELFKEAVMDYMVNDTRVRRFSKKGKQHHAARRILAAAACLLLVAALTVLTIPNARAAVGQWLREWFSASKYFQQDKENRQSEPGIEAIITEAGENSVTVTEIGQWQEAYAESFTLTFDEIAYDGSSIYLTGTMPGPAARPFVQAYTGGDTFCCAKENGGEYAFYACENFVKLETESGAVFCGELEPAFTEEMNEICRSTSPGEPVFEEQILVSSNPAADALWDAYLSAHDVRFSIEFGTDPQDPPLSGIVNGKVSLRLAYYFPDGVAPVLPETILEADLGSVAIDADAYRTGTMQAEVGAGVQLGGIHPVTIHEWQPTEERTEEGLEVYLYTRELDFSGAAATLSEITFTPTDTELKLHVVLPEAWTVAERRADIGALQFCFLLDGKELRADELFSSCGTGLDYTESDWLEYDYTLRESTVPPSEWAKTQTLTIIPMTVYWWDMLVRSNGGPWEPFSLLDGAVHTGGSNHTGYEYDPLYDLMPEYAITISLEDYR